MYQTFSLTFSSRKIVQNPADLMQDGHRLSIMIHNCF